MKQEEIALQLWEYIDGTCTEAERLRIDMLIEQDAQWEKMHAELKALNAGIAMQLEPDQPSMRFSKNVMEVIATAAVKKPTKQYINTGVIRLIGAFFIVIIIACFIYMALDIHWEGGTQSIASKSNLVNMQINGFFNSTVFNIMVLLNIVLGLVFVDKLLRSRKTHQH